MLTPAEREIVKARLRTYPKGLGDVWGSGPLRHTTEHELPRNIMKYEEFG